MSSFDGRQTVKLFYIHKTKIYQQIFACACGGDAIHAIHALSFSLSVALCAK